MIGSLGAPAAEYRSVPLIFKKSAVWQICPVPEQYIEELINLYIENISTQIQKYPFMDKIFSIFNALLFYWDKENFNSILSYFQNKKILTSITNNLFCNNCCKTLLLLIKFSPDILLNSIDSNDFSSAIYNLCNYNSIDFEFALSFFINSTSDIFEYSIYIIIKIIKKFITACGQF